MESKQAEEFEQIKRRMLGFYEGDDRDAYFFEQGLIAAEESASTASAERIENAEIEAESANDERDRAYDSRDTAEKEAERLRNSLKRITENLRRTVEELTKEGG